MPVLSAALYQRFSSRGEADYQDKLLSAMRFQFGGHHGKIDSSHENQMNALHSDALVFFGATGDLAYKKIFPSLQAMMKRGNLDVPVIGVGQERMDSGPTAGADARQSRNTRRRSRPIGIREVVRLTALCGW